MNLGFVCATCNSSRWCGRPCKSDPNKSAPWDVPSAHEAMAEAVEAVIHETPSVVLPKRHAKAMKEIAEKIAEPSVRKHPTKTHGKTKISLWVSDDVIDHFKKGGSGWQTRIARALEDMPK